MNIRVGGKTQFFIARKERGHSIPGERITFRSWVKRTGGILQYLGIGITFLPWGNGEAHSITAERITVHSVPG